MKLVIAYIFVGVALGFLAGEWSEIFIFSPAYGVSICLYNALFRRKVVKIYVQAATEAAGPEGARRNFYLWVFLCSTSLVMVLSSIIFAIRN